MKTLFIIMAMTVFLKSYPATTMAFFQKNAPYVKLEKVKTSSNQYFSFFRAHRQGKDITCTWGYISIGDVTDFILQRTYEDPYDPYSMWTDICSVANTNLRAYKFTDRNILPGNISYRIIAMNGLTEVDVSDIATVRISQH